MEAIVEQKRASTQGDTRLPRAQARMCQPFDGSVFNLTTSIHHRHKTVI